MDKKEIEDRPGDHAKGVKLVVMHGEVINTG